MNEFVGGGVTFLLGCAKIHVERLMNLQRRELLIAAASAGAVGVGGTALLATQDNDDESDVDNEDPTATEAPTEDRTTTGTRAETETTEEEETGTESETETTEETEEVTDRPVEEMLSALKGNPTIPSEGTAEYMQYLPKREGDPSHPPLYSGESVFDEETTLVISSVETMKDELADGGFNQKVAFYEPSEYLNFAASYWEKSFDNLTVEVETPRIGEDAHKDADIRVKWMDFDTFFTAINDSDKKFMFPHTPLSFAAEDETLETTDVVDVNLNAFAGAEMFKHSLITTLGSALGVPFEENGIMQERMQYNTKRGQEIEREYREEIRNPVVKEIMETALSSRKLLLDEQFSKTTSNSRRARSRINSLPELVNPVLQDLIDEEATYAILAVYELVYFYATDVRSVFNHLEFQAANEESSFVEVDGGDAPILHAYRHKAASSIKVSNAIQASVYESWVGLDLDIRTGKPFDPDNYDYY